MKDFKLIVNSFFCLQIMLLCFTSCQKNDYVNAKIVDCRNLFLDGISLIDSEISLSVENTCKNCEEVQEVYLKFEIFDLSNGQLDTIAISNQIYWMPKNETKADYSGIKTSYTTLPSIENIRVDFDKYCSDMSKN